MVGDGMDVLGKEVGDLTKNGFKALARGLEEKLLTQSQRAF